MLTEVKKIFDDNTTNNEFEKLYYTSKNNELCLRDKMESSIQNLWYNNPVPYEMTYNEPLTNLDFLLKNEDWVKPELRNNKRLWNGILAEASFLIECSLDLFESEQYDENGVE